MFECGAQSLNDDTTYIHMHTYIYTYTYMHTNIDTHTHTHQQAKKRLEHVLERREEIITHWRADLDRLQNAQSQVCVCVCVCARARTCTGVQTLIDCRMLKARSSCCTSVCIHMCVKMCKYACMCVCTDLDRLQNALSHVRLLYECVFVCVQYRYICGMRVHACMHASQQVVSD
jgi:hypothetical protein